jgi:hypothetical protein
VLQDVDSLTQRLRRRRHFADERVRKLQDEEQIGGGMCW